MKKILWIILMGLLGLFGSGCTTTTKLTEGMTPEEKTTFLEQREYDRIAKREKERDEIRAYVAACDASPSHTMVYDGPTSINRRHNKQFIPRHARISDFKCMRNADLREWLRRNMGSSY